MKQKMISMLLATSLSLSGCISGMSVLTVNAADVQEVEKINGVCTTSGDAVLESAQDKGEALEVFCTGNTDKYEKLRKNINDDKKDLKESVEEYKYDKEVTRKEIVDGTTTEDMDALNWGSEMVHVDEEPEQIAQKQKIKVAVIDSGINFSEDIEVAERKNFIPDDIVDEEGITQLYEDISGHGTNIAGVIAAKDNDIGVTGVNSNVELYSARVLDANMKAPISRVIEAIDWAIEKEVDIINLSFTTQTNSAELLSAIQRAYAEDILLVAAAGNSEDGSAGVMYPAAYAEVMAIGSVNVNGEVSSFSPNGKQVELVAPGELITSTDVFDTVSTHSGTSYAAPYVTGIASKLWEKDKECSRDFIRAVLDISANLYGNENAYGYGLVDYAYAEKVYDALKPMAANEQDYNKIVDYAVNVCGITNPSTVPVMNKTEDMVEGAWKWDKHKEIVDDISLKTDRGRRLLLAGCLAPDNPTEVKLKGMTLYPYFHGCYRYINGNAKDYSNYIAGCLYLTKIAEAMMKGTLSKGYPADPIVSNGRNLGAFIDNEYINKVQYVRWTDVESYIEGKAGTDFNPHDKKQRALVVYGMALHSMADIFAHSAMPGPNQRVITHDEKNSADSIDVIPKRYEAAKRVCQNALEQICGMHQKESSRDYSNYGHCTIDIFKFLVEGQTKDKKKYYDYFRLVGFNNFALVVCEPYWGSLITNENSYSSTYARIDAVRLPGVDERD